MNTQYTPLHPAENPALSANNRFGGKYI